MTCRAAAAGPMPAAINALAIRPDGSALVSLWPPMPCAHCRRATAIGVVVFLRVGMRNVFRCFDCEDLHSQPTAPQGA